MQQVKYRVSLAALLVASGQDDVEPHLARHGSRIEGDPCNGERLCLCLVDMETAGCQDSHTYAKLKTAHS